MCYLCSQQNNPTPWNNIEQGTQTKLMNINVRAPTNVQGKFDKVYVRDRL